MNYIKKISMLVMIALISQSLSTDILQASQRGNRQASNRQNKQRSTQKSKKSRGPGGTRATGVSDNRNNRSNNRNNRNDNRTNRNHRNPKVAQRLAYPNAGAVAGAAAVRNTNQQQDAVAAWVNYCSQNGSTDSRCSNYNNQQTTTEPQPQQSVIIVQ